MITWFHDNSSFSKIHVKMPPSMYDSFIFLEEDAFDESPTRSIIRRKSIIREPGRKSSCSNRKNVTFGSLPTELTVRSAKDCLKHMFAVS